MLARKDLVKLQESMALVINGVFAVKKGEVGQRLIIDARNANRMFPEPPKVELPNPDIFASVVMDPREELVITKSDMDNFYHRLGMPSWLSQYFGLPAITNDAGRKVWPVVRSPRGMVSLCVRRSSDT